MEQGLCHPLGDSLAPSWASFAPGNLPAGFWFIQCLGNTVHIRRRAGHWDGAGSQAGASSALLELTVGRGEGARQQRMLAGAPGGEVRAGLE